jgi:hypothetical protein
MIPGGRWKSSLSNVPMEFDDAATNFPTDSERRLTPTHAYLSVRMRDIMMVVFRDLSLVLLAQARH